METMNLYLLFSLARTRVLRGFLLCKNMQRLTDYNVNGRLQIRGLCDNEHEALLSFVFFIQCL
ncbi:hypothetical protein KUCAC02_004498 [Chaenocephalus aceratus]|uniref:Uncharacterized protein n=1 Tax=Chaenocephalus aceratus TaxID=36190 RepID=A0ACB9WYY1_CHAAC|nr:hypothetical protein KUCAC02_004498 [Chaenocephalus aceratus]